MKVHATHKKACVKNSVCQGESVYKARIVTPAYLYLDEKCSFSLMLLGTLGCCSADAPLRRNAL